MKPSPYKKEKSVRNFSTFTVVVSAVILRKPKLQNVWNRKDFFDLFPGNCVPVCVHPACCAPDNQLIHDHDQNCKCC